MANSTRYFYGKEQMRDHRDEHPGCKVMWPWLKWCSNYRYASQLVGYALEDVATMDKESFDFTFQNCRRFHGVTRMRRENRNTYISYREGWREDEYEELEATTRFMGEHIPMGDPFYQGRSFEEHIQHLLFHRQQVAAVHVLYAYGMFDNSTGILVLDNLKKLK